MSVLSNKNRGTAVSTVKHDLGVTIRFSTDSYTELQRIAMFEDEKVAVLCRRILFEKIQTYERNPAYKRFLKRLEEGRNR